MCTKNCPKSSTPGPLGLWGFKLSSRSLLWAEVGVQVSWGCTLTLHGEWVQTFKRKLVEFIQQFPEKAPRQRNRNVPHKNEGDRYHNERNKTQHSGRPTGREGRVHFVGKELKRGPRKPSTQGAF